MLKATRATLNHALTIGTLPSLFIMILVILGDSFSWYGSWMHPRHSFIHCFIGLTLVFPCHHPTECWVLFQYSSAASSHGSHN